MSVRREGTARSTQPRLRAKGRFEKKKEKKGGGNGGQKKKRGVKRANDMEEGKKKTEGRKVGGGPNQFSQEVTEDPTEKTPEFLQSP